ncbi:unnamed protein product [Somion occarium]|uniref:Major facilitator superfamily (MFS) profile domain-containing protein n=1 Tax=Somion occarium TaxID=3059160 RepID=A0ABP1E2R6_9APHY
MDQSTLPASWRSRSAAVLPLAFLQSLAFGFIELPAIYLFHDICRDPAVQKAYSIDVAIYLALSTICSIAVSGPFGRLSDMRGRKIVMSSAACLNAIGDFWLFLSALLPAIRNPYSLMLSAFIKGMGGSFSVVQAAQSAFVADTSSSTTRSFYLGLALVMFWIASAIAPLGVSFLLREDHYAACFGIASGCWIIYLLYSVFIIQETRVPSGQKNDQANQTATPTSQNENISQPEPRRAFFQSLTEPLVFIFRDPTLRWLALTTLSMLIAIGAFSVLVVYCDFMFGMRASEAGIIASIMSMARAFSVLCVLPAFLALYRKLYANRVYKLNNTTHSNGASETSPLLAEHDTQASQNNTPSTDQTSASAAQELLVARSQPGGNHDLNDIGSIRCTRCTIRTSPSHARRVAFRSRTGSCRILHHRIRGCGSPQPHPIWYLWCNLGSRTESYLVFRIRFIRVLRFHSDVVKTC